MKTKIKHLIDILALTALALFLITVAGAVAVRMDNIDAMLRGW